MYSQCYPLCNFLSRDCASHTLRTDEWSTSGQCEGHWYVYLSLCLQTKTGQWAWWTTKSLTLPIIVRRNLPIPLVPVTTNVAFSFCATSTIAWPGLSAFSTRNSASICKNYNTGMLKHKLAHICQVILIIKFLFVCIYTWLYAYPRSPDGTVANTIGYYVYFYGYKY